MTLTEALTKVLREDRRPNLGLLLLWRTRALVKKMPRGVKRKAPALAAIGEDESGSSENANAILLAKKIEQIDIAGIIYSIMRYR